MIDTNTNILYLKNAAYDLGEDVFTISSLVLDIDDFRLWTGCVGNKHHYGKGGLAQHTCEVVILCENNRMFCEHWGHKICKRELYLAALFHDVGKLWDYRPINEDFTEWESTPHKRKIHHISRSGLFWSHAVKQTDLFTDIHDDVLHAILSHHGRREWGSPVFPATRVAWLLHLCDNLSARINDCDKVDLVHN